MWVDINEEIGKMSEGFNRGVYKYSSKIEFDPKLVSSIENSYGYTAGNKLKSLKDTFSRLEQVSMSTRTIEKKKLQARENLDKDKYGLKSIKGEAYVRNRDTRKNKIVENLHRRTQSNIFRLTTTDKVFDRGDTSLDFGARMRNRSVKSLKQARKRGNFFENNVSINDFSKHVQN